ncbi:MAG: Xaa-Pro peptidase family protein [Phycisphaerae bacterium]|nr:aminopeptidase P family protein [Phycisphaerales bacterium]
MRQKNPPRQFQDRLDQVRRDMREKSIQALLIAHPADYFYLTGFTGEDSAILVTSRSVVVVTDGRFEGAAQKEVGWTSVRFRKGELTPELIAAVQSSRCTRVAIQPTKMSVATREALRKGLKGVRLVDAPPTLSQMRECKNASELKKIDIAIRVAESAYRAMLKTIRIGQTELELAARLEYEMKRRGSTEPAFGSIVAIDANAALPHAVPGQGRVKKGSLILFDWGATLDGYRSDLTRTVFVGSIPTKFKAIYEAVLTSQKKAIAAICAGVRMCDVDAVARQHITDCGFGDRFTHGLGHGLGLDVHESPSLSWRSDQKLRAGMVVTVEPGIYLPGLGGVRIEDDVRVTSKGCQVMSHLSKSLATSVIDVAR